VTFVVVPSERRGCRHPERASASRGICTSRAVRLAPRTGGREHPLRRGDPAGAACGRAAAVGPRLRGRALPPHRSV